jgi:archaemetzincin
MHRGFSVKRRQHPPQVIDRVNLVAVGWVEETLLAFIGDGLSRVFGKSVQSGPPLERPHYAFNGERGQYLAEAIILKLAQIRDTLGGRVLGVTGIDVYRRDGRSILGHADRENRTALVSIKRLQEEYYGLPPNPDRLHERGLKEAIRQVGTTYGLKGCTNPLCPMFDTHELLDLDIKRPFICPRCKSELP